MKNTWLFFVLLVVFQAHSQQFAINIIPRYSLGATMPANYNVVTGSRFLQSEIKTLYSGQLIDVNGNESQYNQNSDGKALDVMFKYTNLKNGNAWGLLLGVFQNKYLQYVTFPSFDYKDYTLTGHYSFYRATGLSVGLRRVFIKNSPIGWYAQMNALYSLKFKTYLGQGEKWGDMSVGTTRYVENGEGDVISHADLQSTSVVISPEVGFVNRGNFGFEVSLSYQIPLNSIYTKQITYYQSNRISGIEIANVNQNSLWINFKIPINVFKRTKTAKPKSNYEQPRRKYTPKPLPEPKPVPEPVVETPPVKESPAPSINGKTVSKGESIVLNAIQFEQGKSDLGPEAKAELDQVADFMRKSPTIKIILSGHTSNEGDYNENIRLSKERVTVCKRYLNGQVQQANERIKIVGYGPSQPLVPNTNPENKAKNRRVALTIESL
jgi:outer membrane protein OmpA-like peptidoglycan-associated protein